MTRLHRQNFLPTVIVNLLLWIICGLIVFFLDPQNILHITYPILHIDIYPNIILFFFTLTLSLTLTLALLFTNTRRGFLASLFLISVLLLKLFKYFYWWSVLIFLVFTTVVELLLIRKRKKAKKQFNNLTI